VIPFFLALIADPEVIIFGGGWGPEGTQASIEVHVASLAKALGSSRPTVLFAGEADTRSVQVSLQEDNEVDEVLGIVFDRREHLNVGYRKKVVPSAKASRDAFLSAIAARAGPNGLIVLGAGHGSPADSERGAALDLWGPDDKVTVELLAKRLEQAKGPVAFVLGQCHSGAFTDLIYAGGKAPKLASPERCVLAAVPHDREAAGCTPDLDDPSADAYMAMIAEAFLKHADFDGDGATSLAEAHAYARIHDRTVDLPVASSEAWLMAKLGPRVPHPDRVSLKPMLASMPATERAVLEQLESGRLFTEGPSAIAEELDELEASIDDGSKSLDDVLDARDGTRQILVDAVLSKWPELSNPYHHVSRNMLSGDAREVVEYVKQNPHWRRLMEQEEEIRSRDMSILSLEKRAAVLSRFLRAVQVVAGERLLSRRDQTTLRALRACEAMKPKAVQP
jgi:hypothetical protein